MAVNALNVVFSGFLCFVFAFVGIALSLTKCNEVGICLANLVTGGVLLSISFVYILDEANSYLKHDMGGGLYY